MKYLKLSNKGELDIRLVSLMGGSTKSNDKFKIGCFGTGLKYTLAWLFRNNVDFKLFIGDRQVQLHTEKETIRGEEFEIICIDGQRSSITTGMGKEWKAWMIVRELWTNSLDEGRASRGIIDNGMEETMIGEVGTTTFYIQISSDIQDVLDHWDKYFVHEDTECLFSNQYYKLYPAGPHLCIYKNGVLIHENTSVRAVFRYDVLDAPINELREYKSSPACDISKAIKCMDAKNIQYFIDNVTPDHYEGNNMDYNWFNQWGQHWQTFMKKTKLLTSKLRNRFQESSYNFREEEYTVIPECIYQSLTESFDGVGDLEAATNRHQFYEVQSPETEEKIAACTAILRKAKYRMNPEIKYQYGFFEDKTQITAVDEKLKRLMISMAIGQKTAVEIMAILVERNEQLTNNLTSGDAIKKHFINLYINRILPKNREVINTVDVTEFIDV